MYTHARIFSTEKKAEEVGVLISLDVVPQESYLIEKIIYQFPEVLKKAQEERAPHYVVTYLTGLAGEFNSFYGQEKIVDQSDPHAPYKLAISKAVRTILKNGLWVLGIKAPNKM
jgi:arginyl-tRNA synthetase